MELQVLLEMIESSVANVCAVKEAKAEMRQLHCDLATYQLLEFTDR